MCGRQLVGSRGASGRVSRVSGAACRLGPPIPPTAANPRRYHALHTPIHTPGVGEQTGTSGPALSADSVNGPGMSVPIDSNKGDGLCT